MVGSQDPRALHQEQILSPEDEAGVAEGMERYDDWLDARQEAIDLGSEPELGAASLRCHPLRCEAAHEEGAAC